MFTKDAIREQIKSQRLRLTKEEVKRASAACTARLLSLAEYQECQTILVYSAIQNEIDTTAIIKNALDNKKTVGLPVSYDDGKMEFYSVFDLSLLSPGRFGILEPPESILIEPVRDAMIFLPAVAYDKRKNRIGYGKGYYDRYMERYPDLYAIGLAYDFQVVDSFETEDYDKPADIIITDTQMIS